MSRPTVIYWFRQDLRLHDNPALSDAVTNGNVLPIYILDTENSSNYAMGEASKVWLHHSLASLSKSLGEQLSLYTGNPIDVLNSLIDTYAISDIYWNRCYEPWQVERDTAIKTELKKRNITVHSHNGSLLWEPWTIHKTDGTPYKVFTPFYRKGCLSAEHPRKPLPKPKSLKLVFDNAHSIPLSNLTLLPNKNWETSIIEKWQIGENGALNALELFLEKGINHYKEGRNLPAKPYTSRLSPHLHFGELSPNQAWHTAKARNDDDNIDCFCSELGWREFSYSQLFFNPSLPKDNLQKKFDRFPWKKNKKHLIAWQKGLTGIPIVDAGMRELWQTGYMHNRVRMIVGSFLVKNLLLHWREGEAWFWDCLFDADLASNSASWQWVAGCGADAAPYFRIFNPVTQGQKFDPDGEYTRAFVPEIAALPNKYLFNPWEAPNHILLEANITLGKEYPKPIVDLKTSRQTALDAFQSLKNTS